MMETARLRLAGWDEPGWRAFLAATNTPQVMEWLGEGVLSPEQAADVYDRLLGYERDLGFTFWRLERRDDGATLGFCGLKRLNAPDCPIPGRLEIGWRLGADFWGRGYAKEAAIACLDYGFDRLGEDEIFAITVPGNRASWGLMERLGMARRPEWDYQDHRLSARLNPTIVYGLTVEDWRTQANPCGDRS